MGFDTVYDYLKDVIDDEGIDYLSREPYEVFKYLTEEMKLDRRVCCCVLSALLAGVVEETLRILGVDLDDEGNPVMTAMFGVIDESNLIPDDDLKRLSKWIQKECFYKKNVADELAEMFLQLFSTENMASWDNRSEEGFKVFCEDEWEYKFHGEQTWHHGGGCVDCYVDISVNFSVEKPEMLKLLVEKDLARNPFMTADAIFEKVSKALDDMFHRDMEDYTESETYYEPYMEDYSSNGEYVLKEFCEKNGLKLIYFECDGSESGFEPDSRW